MAARPRASVGVSTASGASDAGREAATLALNRFGTELAPSAGFVFTTSRLEAKALTEAIRQIVGQNLPLFGSNTNGVISNDFVGYDGLQTAVVLVGGTDLKLEMLHHEVIAFAEKEAGRAMGSLIANSQTVRSGAEHCLFTLFDSVNRTSGKLFINHVTPYIEGMNEVLNTWPVTFGARVMGDMRFNPTYQWCGDRLLQNSAISLLLSGVHAETAILHGCRPTSAYHTVSQAEDSAILEIDGQPALEFIGDILGPEIKQDAEKVRFFVTLGINYGDKWAPFQEESYVNRMCVGVVPEKGAIVMNEPIPAGTVVQLMRRSIDMGYNRRKTQDLIERVRGMGRTPFLGIYVDCAGRGATYYGSDEEEADFVRGAIADQFPLIGIYEAGEIGGVNGRMDVLDWSGSLTVLAY